MMFASGKVAIFRLAGGIPDPAGIRTAAVNGTQVMFEKRTNGIESAPCHRIGHVFVNQRLRLFNPVIQLDSQFVFLCKRERVKNIVHFGFTGIDRLGTARGTALGATVPGILRRLKHLGQ